MKREITAIIVLSFVFVTTPFFVYAKKNSATPRNVTTPSILMYHEVMETDENSGPNLKAFSISPKLLEDEFKYLSDNNYNTPFVSDFFVARERGDGVYPQKTVMLTFDDGTEDVYSVVLPLLKKYNIKITVFANPGFDGTNGRMSYAQLRELSESGLVEIGAHTMTHVRLQEISDDDAREEIIYSKNRLEMITGKPVRAFAYPFGKFGVREEKMVAEAGMSFAFAADESHGKNYTNTLALPRITIGGQESLKTFIRAVRAW